MPLVVLAVVAGLLAWMVLEGDEPQAATRDATRLDVDRSVMSSEDVGPVRDIHELPREPQPLGQVRPDLPGAGEDSLRKIAGVVLRQRDGRPLAKVLVRALADAPNSGQPVPVIGGFSDDDGRFAFEVGDAFRPHTLEVIWHEMRGAYAFDFVQPTPTGRSVTVHQPLEHGTGGAAELVIHLDTGWAVAGRVVDEDGLPLSAVRIAFAHAVNMYEISRKDGTFLFADIPWGEPAELAFRARTGERSLREIAPPVAGFEVDLGDVLLPRAAESR